MGGETVVVTGASGLIAKHAIAEFLRRGYAVRGTLRDPGKASAVAAAVVRAGADPAALTCVTADLTTDAGWREALAGADGVVHMASPFPMEQPDDPEDVIAPARDGTLRVLRAATAAGVPRMVLTSSTVAVMYPAGYSADHVFSESDFTDENTPGLTPYIRSKTIAEKSAWSFVKATPGAPELAVINPGFVQGPTLDDDLSTSHALYLLMARGIYPAAPRIRFPVCDVRDVAIAHALALANPQSAGQRFIVANGETGLYPLGQALARECPDLARKVPKFELPDAAVRGLAVFDKRLRTILPELGRAKNYTSARAADVLGLRPRPAEDAIRDAIVSLRNLGLI